MKYILTILLVFISFMVSAQDILDKLLLNGMCDCIHLLKPDDKQNNEDMFNCMINNLAKDSTVLENELIRQYGEDAENKFYEIGKNYIKNNTVKLVYQCDAFFHMMDTLRLTPLKILNKDSLRKELANFQLVEESKRDTTYYVNRGITYFSLLDFTNAYLDLKKFDSDQENIWKINFLAYAAESTGHYTEAITLYEKLIQLTQQKELEFLSAIAKRKRNEAKPGDQK